MLMKGTVKNKACSFVFHSPLSNYRFYGSFCSIIVLSGCIPIR